MILILGAGLSGLSASYCIGHERCLVLEQKMHPFGHINSEQCDGFTWDQGPHVSFTKHELVREYFAESVKGEYEEFEAVVGNHFRGSWIAHPAQASLHQVPEPERSACLQSFLETRSAETATKPAQNYQEWLERAFGPVFANTFPAVYTQKYWTRPARELTTEWIGGRILYPDVETVKRGAIRAQDRSLHYISKVRYPSRGGYQSFAKRFLSTANVQYGAEVVAIDLAQRSVWLADGAVIRYEKLINTLPLPVFVKACRNAPAQVLEASQQLTCTQLLLVNVAAPHPSLRPEHWMYVYDDDKVSTRINTTERLSPHNAPLGWTGVQTEVYFSRHRPLPDTPEKVAASVEQELIDMKLLDPAAFATGQTSHRHFRHAPWANVVFDHDTAPALNTIWRWLETQGLSREEDDLHPLTDWASSTPKARTSDQSLFMAGRFGQWKYFWSDDCVLRAHHLARLI